MITMPRCRSGECHRRARREYARGNGAATERVAATSILARKANP